MVFYEDYDVIQWVVLIEKCLAAIFSLYYLIKACLVKSDKKTVQKQKNYIIFLSSYLFYIIIVIFNAFFIKLFRASLVGIAIWGLTLGNLIILKYSLHNFYIGDFAKDKRILYTMRFYLFNAILSSIAYTVVVYLFHGYEEKNQSLPIWVFFASFPIILCYLLILFTGFHQLLKLYRKIHTVLINVLDDQNLNVLIKKIRLLLGGGASLFIMTLFLYIDVFFSSRTILAIIGWFFMSIAFIYIDKAYNMSGENLDNFHD